MAREFLCKSANGRAVYFDNAHSHAAAHFDDTPGLRQMVVEALGTMSLDAKDIGTQVDLGRVVGLCDVVTTNESDEVVYGIRRNRQDDGLVPFVKNRRGDPSTSVALHVIEQPDGTYKLSSAWFGVYDGDDEPFPESRDATGRSVEFWNRHAFVYGSQAMMPGTETSAKPW